VDSLGTSSAILVASLRLRAAPYRGNRVLRF
jgi:hypothetical protein